MLVHIRAVPEGGRAASLAGTNLPYTFYDRFTPIANRGIDRRQPLPSTGSLAGTDLPYTFYDRYAPGGIDRRQPLPSAFAARFIEPQTNNGFLTSFLIWRESVTGTETTCSAYIANRQLRVKDVVRFDERENAHTALLPCICLPGPFMLPATSRTPSWNGSIPPLTSGDVGGWIYFNLSTDARGRASQNWVTTWMEAYGRYGVASTAVALENGCSPAR